MNQVLEYYLRAYVNFLQDDWARWLPMAQLAYNSAEHSATKVAPTVALMGFTPSIRVNVEKELLEGGAPSVEERARCIEDTRTLAKEALAKAKEQMAKNYNKRHIAKQFKIGEKVLLRAKNISTVRPNPKLDYRMLGPFTIIDAWGSQSYKLQLPPRYRRLHPVFHVSLLEPYHQREGELTEPPAIPIQGEEEWLVDRIIAQRKTKSGKLQYLIRWEGYSPDEDTWEDADGLQDNKALDDWLADPASQTTVQPKRATAKLADKTAENPTSQKTTTQLRRSTRKKMLTK